MTNIICGVDVSSQTLDARIGPEGPSVRVDRTADGIQELASFCGQHGAELVVMEATGGYEKLPFMLLWAAGVPCAIVNPRSVRRFAEAMGLLEKTDRLDAGIIAHFAAVKRIVAQQPASETQQRLAAAVGRLRQLTNFRTVQLNQRRLVTDADVLASIDGILALLRTQIRQFEHSIAAMVDADPLWQQLDAVFRGIKGVADRTVVCLMANLPEIGTLSNKGISKLVGLAPLAKDSRKFVGQRHVRGGRSPVRSILFVVAEIVRRHDPDFAAFHQKLALAGKPKK